MEVVTAEDQTRWTWASFVGRPINSMHMVVLATQRRFSLSTRMTMNAAGKWLVRWR